MTPVGDDGEPVVVQRHGRTLLVRLNRPTRRNAFDLPAMHAVGAVLATAIDDGDVAVIVLAARGPVFSAGVDLTAYGAALASTEGAGEMNAAAQAGADAERPGLGVLIRDYYPKPVVCAVDGPAIGLGCELVLASDIVVASPRATFGLPEVRYGLAPSGGGAGRLVKRLASSRAMWMLLSGESMDAQLAERFGLVTALTAEDDDPAEVALRMAGVIADQSPEAVRATKLLAVRSTGWFDEEIRRLSDTVIDRMSRSADAVSRVGGFSAARRDA